MSKSKLILIDVLLLLGIWDPPHWRTLSQPSITATYLSMHRAVPVVGFRSDGSTTMWGNGIRRSELRPVPRSAANPLTLARQRGDVKLLMLCRYDIACSARMRLPISTMVC